MNNKKIIYLQFIHLQFTIEDKLNTVDTIEKHNNYVQFIHLQFTIEDKLNTVDTLIEHNR